MELDLDALELRALRFHKLNPLHECFDSATVLALIARLREAENERDRYREAIETARDHEWSGYGKSDTWHILTRALNDEEAEK